MGGRLLDWVADMHGALRLVTSTFTAIALVFSLLTLPCLACGPQVNASSNPPPCCNPDGHCKGSAGGCGACGKDQVQALAVFEQAIHITPILWVDGIRPLFATAEYKTAETASLSQYSPPDLYLFHSAFLI